MGVTRRCEKGKEYAAKGGGGLIGNTKEGEGNVSSILLFDVIDGIENSEEKIEYVHSIG